MPDSVSEIEKSSRLAELQSLQKRIQTELNASNIGKTFEVLVDSKSRRREHEMCGRTTQNTVVNFPGETNWIGDTVNVKIDSAGPNSLHGTVIALN
jgi:tRNA-2-methylthio-N6-dimethylallyladenosine synthase